MARRIPASMRTREALAALIEGRLASPAGRSELVELATRLIVEGRAGLGPRSTWRARCATRSTVGTTSAARPRAGAIATATGPTG